MQPKLGADIRVTFSHMGRRSKKDRPAAISQRVLADNLVKLRDRAYAGLPNETARNKRLAKESDMSLSQIQRIIKCTLAPGIDILERLANAFNVRPADLLTPYFAVHDYQHPPSQDTEITRTGTAIHEPTVD